MMRADDNNKTLERVSIQTSDPDIATEAYRDFSRKSELTVTQWGGPDFSFRSEILRLPHMSLIRFQIRNGSITRTVNNSRQHISVTMPLREGIEGLGITNCGAIGPGLIRQYRAIEGFSAGFRDCDVATVIIQQQWADDIVNDLANEIVNPLKTRPLISSRSGYGASLLRLISYSWWELSGNSIKHPAAMKQMEEHIATLFWLSVMADDNTAACEASSVPNYLRRAEEFIVANLTDPPSLDKIAHVANVSVSTLTRFFKKRYGVGPVSFMKRRRLEMARDQLLMARDEGKTVTTVAMGLNFFHLGQFAIDYRKIFGESPSETLRHH